MVAYELLHTMKNIHKRGLGSIALKLDMCRAYDKIVQLYGCNYGKDGFCRQVEKILIMCCVCSVSYSNLVNGYPSESFYSTKGIRQEDHLFSYLYILFVEGLGTLIQHAKRKGDIQGVSVSRGGSCINYLLFTNDNIVLCRVLKRMIENSNYLAKYTRMLHEIRPNLLTSRRYPYFLI